MSKRRHDLVLELAAVDGLAASSGTSGVAALDHETRDDAVEDYVVVFTRFGQGGEVLAGLIMKVSKHIKFLGVR